MKPITKKALLQALTAAIIFVFLNIISDILFFEKEPWQKYVIAGCMFGLFMFLWYLWENKQKNKS